jgi:hypothetical protein
MPDNLAAQCLAEAFYIDCEQNMWTDLWDT